jgi:hypothetical protein
MFILSMHNQVVIWNKFCYLLEQIHAEINESGCVQKGHNHSAVCLSTSTVQQLIK